MLSAPHSHANWLTEWLCFFFYIPPSALLNTIYRQMRSIIRAFNFVLSKCPHRNNECAVFFLLLLHHHRILLHSIQYIKYTDIRRLTESYRFKINWSRYIQNGFDSMWFHSGNCVIFGLSSIKLCYEVTRLWDWISLFLFSFPFKSIFNHLNNKSSHILLFFIWM